MRVLSKAANSKWIWLTPLVILFVGMVPGVLDSALWKYLGAVLFLGGLFCMVKAFATKEHEVEISTKGDQKLPAAVPSNRAIM
ncbi:hypothetical protein [Paenibacillus chitinolyticus]|uniref:hypothetical protein n=1 Tax=Paenibacillus chitinolyticus TaxID=79263 RepID=UPI001C43C8AC|nr:hypothetical protein [Paenibacillus chitinolyticus]MBV6717187.1 hypothetical protein [Paenibacillus chitinolyticus]